MFFFFKGRKKKHRNRGTRATYKARKKDTMGYVQSIMLCESITNKRRFIVYTNG